MRQRQLIAQASERPEDGPLAAPPLVAQTKMARHLTKEHGFHDFRLERDVYLGATERRDSQLLSWSPVQATFRCQRCDGLVVWTGEITDSMLGHAQRFDDGLRPYLTGLESKEERDEMTRLYLSGSLNKERLRELRRAGPKRRAVSDKRPVVAERRNRIQDWLLSRYAEHGVFQRVLEEALEMQHRDPASWREIALCDHRSESSLRRDWQDIDPERKAKTLPTSDPSQRRGN